MRLPTHEASLGFLLLVAFSVKIAAPRTYRPTDAASSPALAGTPSYDGRVAGQCRRMGRTTRV